MLDLSNKTVNSIYDTLNADHDFLDLFKPFRSSYYNIEILDGPELCGTTYHMLMVNDLKDVIIFMLRFASYSHAGTSNITEKFIISNIKYFYLMLNLAHLIKTDLINRGALLYKGRPLSYRGEGKTLIQLIIDKGRQNIKFVSSLKASKNNLDYDVIDLDISRYFDSELDFTFCVSIDVFKFFANGSKSHAVERVDNVTKSLLQELLDKI